MDDAGLQQAVQEDLQWKPRVDGALVKYRQAVG